MAYEQLNGTDMMGEFLGKCQRLTSQTGNPLSQGVIEPLNMFGLASQRAAGSDG